MTATQFEILLHYYSNKSIESSLVVEDRGVPRGSVKDYAVEKSMAFLLDEKLLEPIDHKNLTDQPESDCRVIYKITDRGRIYCATAIAIPLPVWRVPI